MSRRLERVRRQALRVALLATGVVAAGYALVSLAVVGIVTHALTSAIDDRLSATVSAIQVVAQGGPPQQIPAIGSGPGPDRFGPRLLIWEVDSAGTVAATDSSATLPNAALAATSPTTVSIGGTDFRVAGTTIGNDRWIVGEALSAVDAAQSTVITAEAIIAPFLLALVFLGSLAVGRRVGAPIELARQRQMEFTADASHELRTPLSVIEAHTTLALAQDRPVEWYRDAFGKVSVETTRIRHMVDDLLWLARFDAARPGPASEPLDLSLLARAATDRFQSVAEALGISLTAHITDGVTIKGPADWIDRLLGVLLDNACKYTPPQGQVRVTVAADGHHATLAVEDSGRGIPESERDRIFDRFHRSTEEASGTGLGLAIANAVVESSRGRWTITTSGLGGAHMEVSWPLVVLPAA